LINFELLA